MKARIKENGVVLDLRYDNDKSIKTGTSVWVGFLDHDWVCFNEKEIEFVNDIDWQSVRKDIAMEILKQIPFDALNRSDTWVDAVFERANELTKKLMEEIT